MSVGPKSALLKAISEIQNDESINLVKNETGQVGSRSYKYLTLDKLHSAVFPKLKEHGLVWVTMPTEINGEAALGYELSHVESGESISEGMLIFPPKPDPQGLGAAITYARRYALLSVLGLVGEDDTDGTVSEPQRKSVDRSDTPQIPPDRAKRILEAAQATDLADGTNLAPALKAALVAEGVETGKIGHLNVDQAENIEAFIAKEAE